MHLHRGRNRLVVIIGGLAVKFPIIHLRNATHLVWYHIRKKHFGRLLAYPLEDSGSLKYSLFKGLSDNWLEFTFYLTHRFELLMPTYLSLFGLLNVQKAGRGCSLDPDNLWCQLYEMTDGEVFEGGSHHFENPDNFCVEDGHLRILDYGSRRVQSFLLKHADSIFQQFDLTYSWEERKKQLARGEC